MTDDDKTLVESLRDMPVWPMEEAADRIEALSAEIRQQEWLVKTQREIITRLRKQLDSEQRLVEALMARAALGETK